MHVLRRENLDQFIQNAFQEIQNAVFGAENLLKNSPSALNLIAKALATEFRIGSQCGRSMSRQIYLGNNLYVSCLCVCHKLF